MTVSVFSVNNCWTPENHDDESDAVAQLGHERAPLAVGKVRAKEPFGHQREPHGQAGRQT